MMMNREDFEYVRASCWPRGREGERERGRGGERERGREGEKKIPLSPFRPFALSPFRPFPLSRLRRINWHDFSVTRLRPYFVLVQTS